MLNIITRDSHETEYSRSKEHKERQRQIAEANNMRPDKDIDGGDSTMRRFASIDTKDYFDKINNVDRNYWDDPKNVERHLRDNPNQKINHKKKYY